MAVIDSRLTDFKKSVDSKTSAMTDMCTTLGDKLTTLANATQNAKSSINNIYDSENKNKTLTKMDSLSNILSKISTSVKSDLMGMVSAAENLVSLVGELEELKKQIDTKNGIANSETATAEEKTSASGEASRLNGEFNNKHNTAIEKYTALLGMDSNLAFVEEFSPSNNKGLDLSSLSYGSYDHYEYKASNGEVLDYYFYMPDYGKEVEGVALHTYLHGSGEAGGRILSCGLPKMIADRSITPECAVLAVQSPDQKAYFRASYQDAIIELTNKLVAEHNLDQDKVSISGHSMGAIAGYRIISRYPDYYSAFVPISGYNNSGEIHTSTKVWGFHGSDDVRISVNDGKRSVNQVKNPEGNTSLYVLEGKGHAYVQNYVFENEFQDAEGETINPLTWAARQTRA